MKQEFKVDLTDVEVMHLRAYFQNYLKDGTEGAKELELRSKLFDAFNIDMPSHPGSPDIVNGLGATYHYNFCLNEEEVDYIVKDKNGLCLPVPKLKALISKDKKLAQI